ncbi:MAG: hypothetical protein OZSIB_3934 [Candidatus Ozemobacter sibiricus]|uniref:Uncharacterized protein n=1 Tax=Candidatus Ozemobacter sibiricus TaxID=2268124 RepID=A0A367ZP15_9BACT|nr:MAG: hypothetical protein OZSIB_3934 [Candidatus Ozemobacter sibiricus]
MRRAHRLPLGPHRRVEMAGSLADRLRIGKRRRRLLLASDATMGNRQAEGGAASPPQGFLRQG